MGSTTVVDQLIVKLGLDPRDFTKGEKEIASGVLKTKETVRKGAADMSDAVASGAKSIAASGGIITKVLGRGGVIGLAIAASVVALKKFNDLLYGIAEDTRNLGRDAKNFNLLASGLRNAQNAAELAGGSLEDANSTVAGLAKSLFDLKFNGQISDSLITLARLGVQFTDASGKARDFKDVTLDTADALERAQKSGMMSRADAFQFAQQAGFNGGLANLVVGGRQEVADAFARQEARRQVAGSDVDIATRRVNANLSLGQAATANAGVPAMAKESPLAIAASEAGERTIVGGANLAGEIGDHLGRAADKASVALGDLADTAKGFWERALQQHAQFHGAAKYGAALDAAADKYGIDRDVFRGIARTESSFNPNAIASKNGKVTGAGLMGLNPQFFPSAGKDVQSDINTSAALFASLLEKTDGTEQERYVAALKMYHAGETNYRRGTNLGPENAAYPGKVLAGSMLALPTPGLQGGATSIHNETTFEAVNIYSSRTDGRDLAEEFTDTTRRKMLAAHAEAGVQ